MQQQLTDEGNVNRTTGDASGSSMVAASDAGGATAVARRPRILLVTDRTPGGDSGYGMRVDNVIVGLMEAGDLHVCLIDSSTGGASLPVNAGYETTTIRAENPPRWRKLLLAATSLAQVPYRRQAHLRAALAQRFGDEPWDVVWFSRIRTYSIFRGLVGGSHVVDFDDLNDRLAFWVMWRRDGGARFNGGSPQRCAVSPCAARLTAAISISPTAWWCATAIARRILPGDFPTMSTRRWSS